MDKESSPHRLLDVASALHALTRPDIGQRVSVGRSRLRARMQGDRTEIRAGTLKLGDALQRLRVRYPAVKLRPEAHAHDQTQQVGKAVHRAEAREVFGRHADRGFVSPQDQVDPTVYEDHGVQAQAIHQVVESLPQGYDSDLVDRPDRVAIAVDDAEPSGKPGLGTVQGLDGEFPVDRVEARVVGVWPASRKRLERRERDATQVYGDSFAPERPEQGNGAENVVTAPRPEQEHGSALPQARERR